MADIEPSGKKLLVVDDDDDLRGLLALVLSEEGFQVDSAMDGQQAVEKVAAAAPDLMVLDLMLPRLPGWEVLEKLDRDQVAAFPVLVISGVHKTGPQADAARRNPRVFHFLEKPFDLPELKKLLHDRLGTRPRA